MNVKIFLCYNCGYKWDIPYGLSRPDKCPECESTYIHRSEEDRGHYRNSGGGFGRGRGHDRRHGQNCSSNN